MKKIIIYLLFCTTLLVSSCEVLDIEPTTSWSGLNFPTNEAHLSGLLSGGYERLQVALRTNFLVYGEMRAGVFYNNTFNLNVDKVISNKLDYGMSYASWRTFYEAIKQANLVLKYTPDLLAKNVITKASADNIMGQAYALRAYTYFYIVRIWGDAPLLVTPLLSNADVEKLKRESQEKIFERIHLDLEESANLIPASANSRTAFTRTAAYAIDAHAYAWEHNYSKVLERTNQVLGNTNYTLATLYNPLINVSDKDFKQKVQASEFAGIFNVGRSKESIFELSFSLDDGDDSKYLSTYLSGDGPILRPNISYAKSFDDADWRAVVSNERSSTGVYKAVKFTIGFSSDVDTRNIVLLRLADIYLLKAEAIANLGDTDTDRKNTMDIVNKIRNRAGGPAFEIPQSEYLDRQNFTSDNLKSVVLNERKFELSYEGYRWFDLIRCGKAIEVVRDQTGIELDPRSLVWPIDEDELKRGGGVDGIEQNEYYK